jgi:hypothetical protein
VTTTLTDEFVVGQAPGGPPARPGHRPRTRRDRSVPWVVLAAVTILLGVVVAPTPAPRTASHVPGWAGLASFVVMETDGDADVVALARDAVDRVGTVEAGANRMTSDDEDAERLGVVVLVVPDSVEPINEVLYDVPIPSPETTAILEAAAPGEDWVCEADARAQTTCTSLREGVVVVIDDVARS